ncbi:MAG: Fe-S cluster assembly protein SufD [Candidatus Eremiobacteraeota bacterium]|nr:Fe-S cluster assembly protein SufD [Candidatus Eremiobacteraeota bacterium]
MSSVATAAVQSSSAQDELARDLWRRLDALNVDAMPLSSAQRRNALERFLSVRSGRERPGRFWRVDFERLAPAPGAIAADAPITYEGSAPGVIVTSLRRAAREHPALLARAFGSTGAAATKFGALTEAFANGGAFVYVPADRSCDEPIVLRCDAADGAAVFPWNVVFAERGARAVLVEHVTGAPGAFICGVTEIVTEESADVTYAVVQRLRGGSSIASRTARPGRDASVAWAVAELGADLAASDLTVSIDSPGASAQIASLFFPASDQHVDVVSSVEHNAGDATSETLVKSAARDRGQARFLGNIRIAPHAQGSDARLRDDALLLSPRAHVDSVPALEIGANDVKAYHGATVGAIDAEQIFYMESRGLERNAAERMIALGFFEPAIERFPTSALRDEIRNAVAAKLA